MTTPFLLKLHNLATSIKDHADEAIRDYSPKLEAAAHLVEEALDRWLGYVDDHLADWENAAIVEAKRAAFTTYREAQKVGLALVEELRSLGV